MFAWTFVGLLALGGCSDPPLVGPCGALNRKGPDDAYDRLALDLFFQRYGLMSHLDATQEKVDARLAVLKGAWADWLPTIGDACLRAHASDWVTFEEGDANRAMSDVARWNGVSSQYEADEAEREGQVRALRAKLGVQQ